MNVASDNRVYQDFGYAKRGKKLYGSRTGKRTARENLIAAKREKELLSPMLITGSINAKGLNNGTWQWLMLELHPDSTLIMDNAPIHRKNKIKEIVEVRGHQVLFLPKYSPDFNQIEHDFAAMKKRRKYASQDTDVAQIVKNYSERNSPLKTYLK